MHGMRDASAFANGGGDGGTDGGASCDEVAGSPGVARSRPLRSPRAACAAVLAAALLAAPGCCGIARAMCPSPPPATARHGITRDTPRDTIRFLVDAIKRNNPSDIYATLHPKFVQASGGYSLSEFVSAYEYFREEFQSDAARLDEAIVDEPFDRDGLRWWKVHDGDAYVYLAFINQPRARVLLDDEYIPEIVSRVGSVSRAVEVDGDTLVVTAPIPLQGQGSLVSESMVKRVEISNDWLVYDMREPQGIQFADVIQREVDEWRRRSK